MITDHRGSKCSNMFVQRLDVLLPSYDNFQVLAHQMHFPQFKSPNCLMLLFHQEACVVNIQSCLLLIDMDEHTST